MVDDTQRTRAEEVFQAAIEIDSSAERMTYLDESCGDDRQLRAEVDALLQHDADAGSFLERPLEELRITIDDSVTSDEASETWQALLEPAGDLTCLGLLGPYRIHELLGRGGMGVVLRAHDPKLNRPVAVKLLAPELAVNPMSVRRFLREAQAAAAVSHDHVITIHAIDEQARPPRIVMEFVDGLSLQQKIDDTGALDVKSILRIGMQTAAGLAAAHRQGLVHRDIKPSNILLENGVERVKLTDFGLARAVDDIGVTRTGQITGTPQYMSPEQARAERLDHRTDLFSLGSVLYAMCTGRAAFRADSALAVMHRVVHETPQPIRNINEDIPEWLCDIIHKLLEKNPDERFESAAEVESLLGRHLAHLQQPSSVPQPPPIDRPHGPVSAPGERSAAARFWTEPQPGFARRVGWPGIVLLLAWMIVLLAVHSRGASQPSILATLIAGIIGLPIALALLTFAWVRSNRLPKPGESTAVEESRSAFRTALRPRSIVAALIGTTLIAMAAIAYWQSTRGTVVIHSDHPQAMLRIHRLLHDSSEGGRMRFRIQYPGVVVTGSGSVRLPRGAYRVWPGDEFRDQIRISQDQFVLGGGEYVEISVSRMPQDAADTPPVSTPDSVKPVADVVAEETGEIAIDSPLGCWQGTWIPVEARGDAAEFGRLQLLQAQLRIDGIEATWQSDEITSRGWISLDSKASPHGFEVVLHDREPFLQGNYELFDDQLMVAFNLSNEGERPTGFEDSRATTRFVRYRRQRENREPQAQSAEPSDFWKQVVRQGGLMPKVRRANRHPQAEIEWLSAGGEDAGDSRFQVRQRWREVFRFRGTQPQLESLFQYLQAELRLYARGTDARFRDHHWSRSARTFDLFWVSPLALGSLRGELRLDDNVGAQADVYEGTLTLRLEESARAGIVHIDELPAGVDPVPGVLSWNEEQTEARAQLPAVEPLILPGDWHDLLSDVDPLRDARGQWWHRDENGDLRINNPGAGFEAFIDPRIRLADDADYVLEVELTTAGQGTAVPIITFPVAKTWCSFSGNSSLAPSLGLERIDDLPISSARNPTTIPGFPLKERTRHMVTIAVRTVRDEADISVRLDGRELLNWRGDVRSLSEWDERRPHYSGGFGLGARVFGAGTTVYHSARVRLREDTD